MRTLRQRPITVELENEIDQVSVAALDLNCLGAITIAGLDGVSVGDSLGTDGIGGGRGDRRPQ